MDPTERRIDSHTHLFDLRNLSPTGLSYWPSYSVTLDDYIRTLDANGTAKAVVVAVSFLGDDPTQILDALARHPERLRGVVTIDASVSPTRLEEMHALGVRGLRFNLYHAPLPDLADFGWRRIVERAQSLGWHIELHERGAKLAASLAAVAPLGTRIVVDHFGLPDPALGPDDPGFRALAEFAARHDVYVKLSGSYRITADAYDGGDYTVAHARRLLEAVGPDRLVWASDFPFTRNEGRFTYADTRRWLDRWVPDPRIRARILWDNAARLFDFE